MGATLHHEAARLLVREVLQAYGATAENASTVADHLVESDRAGLPSHGLIRVPQYVDEILRGEINPAASPTIVRSAPGRLHIDGGRCFGQVACNAAVEGVPAIVDEQGLALATLREIGHAGRIGAYAEQLGALGILSLLFCSGPQSGHRVSPFNGREGRLATNPIAFSVPTGGEPIVGDFSTAAAPEGRIRHLRNLGELAPPETLLDASGRESNDPGVLYRDPPGTIMPLGGLRLGHRGFALALLVEAIATLLSGDESADSSRVGNNVGLIAIRVDASFSGRADRLATYVVNTPARDGTAAVILPGALEQHRREVASTVEVEASVWAGIAERARARGVSLPEHELTDAQKRE